jgi:shikimate kinase
MNLTANLTKKCYFRAMLNQCLKRLIVTKLAVVALGGNALLRDNEKGTIEEQEKPD